MTLQHLERLRLIAPHVTRAANVTLRLSRAHVERNSSVEALNLIGQGVLIVASNGEVLFANRAADRLLGEVDGITVRNGVLCARSSVESACLQKLIASAAHRIEASGGVMALTRPPPRRPLSILVAPLALDSRWAVTRHPAAILFIADPDGRQASAKDQLRSLYGLTPAETAVALGISRGEGLQSVADRLRISLTTARTHLQHVFEKTDTRRQAELVRLIADSQIALEQSS